ncbi:hypothetical protein E2R51_09185 [Jeotgalibacillus sp. S-D1]|uniref:PfkB family carbohydrate kinase n=1 Tax=Jeotgalibacillus sp. S-D1 TaxID=2552189 RepID=UPI0010596D70|nr:PfkB family carbohydrate kinase [Jeotgalibacillus sp. S-D1]TDL32834.1 hypothetical protein E2R51_09185 [Jeotgalibacillus sp. S-D1]
MNGTDWETRPVATARMGADVAMIGCVGQDSYGEELISLLQAENINVDAVMKSDEVSTGIAQVTVADQDNSIIVVPGANHSITKEWINQHIHLIQAA